MGDRLLVEVTSIASDKGLNLNIESSLLMPTWKTLMADVLSSSASNKELNFQRKVDIKNNQITGLKTASGGGDSEAVNIA